MVEVPVSTLTSCIKVPDAGSDISFQLMQILVMIRVMDPHVENLDCVPGFWPWQLPCDSSIWEVD